MNFDELIESELDVLDDECDEVLLDFIEENYDDGDMQSLSEDLDLTLEEATELYEQLVKRVSSRGAVTRVRTASQRRKKATRTTKMSRSALTRRGRKSAKTRRKSPGAVRKAVRKRSKAMRKRKSMGIR